MDLSKKVFGANVSKEIIKYFDDLQRGGFDVELNPLSETVNRDYETYLGDRTPYARMWTAVNVREEAEKSFTGPSPQGGGKNFGKTYVYSINENREGSYNPNELDSLQQEARQFIESSFEFDVNYRPQLDNNQFLKPTAGITSINSKSEGAVGALRRTTVNFIVHNKQDFDNIFLPFFLKPGATVFVDFGWSDKALSLYNPESLISVDNPSMNDFYKRVYDTTLVEKDIKKGLQTTLTGQVTKYDVTVDDKGSFSCTLEFVSSNYALLDKTVSDDNNLKFIFKNAIEEMLMNYYLKFTGINVDINEKKEDINKISVEERKRLVNDFFDKEETPGNVGLIDKVSRTSGVFYQNIVNGQNDEDKLDAKESLYISYGLLEDLFLNNFISFWDFTDDAGELINREKSDEPFSNSFSSQNSYVRFDQDLLNLQGLDFRSKDERTSFLYPNSWADTYNKLKPIGWEDAGGVDNDKAKRRIPLRELFISVPLVSEAFERSTNVNDALEFIFDKIYEDSANIINIKMIQNNDAQTSITFQDINVEADKFGADNEDILTFDLTSGNSVVLNSDLKFETPKAGLSSMIAIGNIDNLTVFDELELIKFNFLNSISTENRKYKVQHLPSYGNVPSKQKSIDVDFYKFNFTSGEAGKALPSQEFQVNQTSVQNRYNKYISERQKKIKERLNSSKNDNGNGDDDTNQIGAQKQPTETSDGKQIFYGKTERDTALLNAKINNFVKANKNSISPVMPITLSLKVYGNNFLGIGDFFTVNFLPKHYQERVYFQVVGVDHSIGTSMWDTTYTTVMRLKSIEKYNTNVNTKSEESKTIIRYDNELKERKTEETHKNKSENLKNNSLSLTTKEIINFGIASNRTEERIPNGFTETDFPTLNVSFDLHKINIEENKEQLNKFLTDIKQDRARTIAKKSINKVPLAVTLPEVYDDGLLGYHIAISNLLLGDQIIDWQKIKQEGKNVAEFSSISPGSNTVISSVKANTIVTRSRLNFKGEINIDSYKPMLKAWDAIEDPWYEDNAFADVLDDNEKIVDNKIKNLKQIISTHIEKFNPNSKVFSSYLFLDSIIWGLEEKGDNEFININVKGHKDVRICNNIFIPKKYLKPSVTPQSFVKILRREYVIQKINLALDENFANQASSFLDTTNNPGYPFSRENYEKPGPWGSSSSVVEARGRLAQNFKDDNGQPFNSYGDYLAARNAQGDSFNRRKEDWDKSPNIW